MHKCEYCERELKSNAGKVRHEKSCKARDIGGQLEEDVGSHETEIYVDDVETEPILTTEESKTDIEDDFITIVETVVQLEVLGGEETYYDGHPRRLIKLKGLLSRTHDRKERIKIHNLILELT